MHCLSNLSSREPVPGWGCVQMPHYNLTINAAVTPRGLCEQALHLSGCSWQGVLIKFLSLPSFLSARGNTGTASTADAELGCAWHLVHLGIATGSVRVLLDHLGSASSGDTSRCLPQSASILASALVRFRNTRPFLIVLECLFLYCCREIKNKLWSAWRVCRERPVSVRFAPGICHHKMQEEMKGLKHACVLVM